MATLAMITMNAGKDIPGSTIKHALKNHYMDFDRIIVVDGNLTDEAIEFYNSLEGCEYVDSPWKDSYVDQYRAFSERLKDGEWCLYLDCDEMPSIDLLIYCLNFIPNFEQFNPGINMCLLPCVLHLTEDGIHYYPSEPKPPENYKQRMWTKHILFKKEKSLDFKYFGSHCIPTHNDNEKAIYVPKPYYHMKSLESFVYNDVWQAFLHPPGQGYTELETKYFRLYTALYKTTKDFKQATLEGNWSLPLQKFAAEKANENNRPISRLAWVYWTLLKHDVPEQFKKYNIPTEWDQIKDYILGKETMDLYKSNKEKENYIEVNND